MRLLFNKTGDILYIIARKKHCIYRVTYNAATHTFGIPELFAGDTENQDMLPVKEQVRVLTSQVLLAWILKVICLFPIK